MDEVFVISRIIKVEVRVISLSLRLRLRLITLTETLIILDTTKTESNNCFIIHWTQKLGSHVSASLLTASNMSRAKLAWLPLEIMHCGHTWHDYSWPWHDYPWHWHDYCIICSYDVTGADYSLTLFWLAESVQWIFEISARNVITADYTIIMSRSRVIMSRSRVIMSCMTAVHDFQG